MPFIAELDTMDSIKDSKKERKEKKENKESKKRKSSAITEHTTSTESMDIDTEMTGADETTASESKKKRSKKEKKEKKGGQLRLQKKQLQQKPKKKLHKQTMMSHQKNHQPKNANLPLMRLKWISLSLNLPQKKPFVVLKKGKPLPPSKSGAESSPEPEAKKKAEVEKRSGHGVWIGNLPWSVSKEELRNWLVEFSDLTEENITRIHMPGPNDGKPANKVEKKFGKPVHNKGFAYVDFVTEEQVKMAVELSEQLLTGRRLLIKDNKSFEGRPEKKEAVVDGKPPSKKIFVGNLRFDATEEILKEHFEKCGAIEKIHVATFEDSGKCKGYAWVVFEDVSAAQSAVKGWVHIEEELSDEESSSSSDSDSNSDSEDEATTKTKKSKKPKTKTRKWWVNKIQGRPLRMEFAEDDQLRYKKRYGKDGSKNPNERHPREERESGARVGANDEPVVPRVPGERRERPVKKVEYRSSYAPRLTGGIVESEGKKTTF
ncbi:hypothetical protein DID88_009343 [Monilinia fructigena]|uniref:RRM domain-containing protein n=1 Tax=Monilinia fructigena TaxID=38457 RepID=A0A395IPS6_9HELO|nr:hypothetical protein DID88_009343 [Monilinia fructigena]